MIIVKVPGLNAFGKTKGCRNVGNEIIKNLKDIGSSEKGKLVEKSNLNFEEIHVDNNNLEEQNDLIYKNALKFFETQDKIIFLGGDHSISFPIGKAFLDYCKEKKREPFLIIFDAHADCCKPCKEPTHEEWLRALIERGFKPEKIMIIGLRNLWEEEAKFLKNNKIIRVENNWLLNNLEEAVDFITESAKGKEVYISLDIDVLDPAFAPGTFYKEPAGLTTRQIIYILQRLNLLKPKAIDIVEVNPELDENKKTIKLTSKILAEFL